MSVVTDHQVQNFIDFDIWSIQLTFSETDIYGTGTQVSVLKR